MRVGGEIKCVWCVCIGSKYNEGWSLSFVQGSSILPGATINRKHWVQMITWFSIIYLRQTLVDSKTVLKSYITSPVFHKSSRRSAPLHSISVHLVCPMVHCVLAWPDLTRSTSAQVIVGWKFTWRIRSQSWRTAGGSRFCFSPQNSIGAIAPFGSFAAAISKL